MLPKYVIIFITIIIIIIIIIVFKVTWWGMEADRDLDQVRSKEEGS